MYVEGEYKKNELKYSISLKHLGVTIEIIDG